MVEELHDGIFLCRGEGSGPRRVLVTGVHGDEVDGVEAVTEFLEGQHEGSPPLKGDLLLIRANLPALEAGARTGPSGIDMNRLFGPDVPASSSWEFERVQLIKSLILEGDLVLDLHQTARPGPVMAVVKNGHAHLRVVQALNFEVAVLGMEAIFGPVMLSQAADLAGAIGITAETGLSGSPESKATCRRLLNRFLGDLGAVDSQAAPATHFWQVREALRCPGPNFRLERPFVNGDCISKGELLGRSESDLLVAPTSGIVLLPKEQGETGSCCMLLADEVSNPSGLRPDEDIDDGVNRALQV